MEIGADQGPVRYETVTTHEMQRAADGASIVRIAAQQLGDPYVFGATGPDEWDCSSLVQWAYRQAGVDLPRTTFEMAGQPYQNVTAGQLQPGDLVFSDWGDGPNSHVALYAGNNKLLEAGSLNGVAYTDFGPNYQGRVTAMRRVPGMTGYAASPTPGAELSATTMAARPDITLPTLPSVGAAIPGSGFVDALVSIASATANQAKSVAEIGGLAKNIAALLLPSNAIRLAAAFIGVTLILLGIWFIASDIKD